MPGTMEIAARTNRIRGASLAGLAAALLSTGVGAQDEQRLAASRALVDTFAARLQSALGAAMADGGPVAAVEVCKDVAPALASELSRSSGAAVLRTTLRPRNPLNAPDAWQAETLTEFERRARGAADGAPLERFAQLDDGATRYMRAIRIAPLCLVCHGDSVDESIAEVLDRHYPHDRARGYGLGDVRGAFSVTWAPTTTEIE